MIGKVIIGKSFRGCLGYCLDKKEAEVLDYNLCGGNKKELIGQFREVANLNPNVSRPVQHITISLAKGEQLGKGELAAIAADCAKEMGFDKNQYVVVLHNDTAHQHFHIVVNRIGFDGRTIKDNHNYKRIAEFSRKMEEKYRLQKVLSPRRYLPKEQRSLPRIDERKKKFRINITDTLWNARNYQDFEKRMNEKGYTIEKARGIAFTDEKKVRIKGSEVNYPLSKIETILSQKPVLQHKQEWKFEKVKQKALNLPLKKATNILLQPTNNPAQPSGLVKKRKRKRRLRL